MRVRRVFLVVVATAFLLLFFSPSVAAITSGKSFVSDSSVDSNQRSQTESSTNALDSSAIASSLAYANYYQPYEKTDDQGNHVIQTEGFPPQSAFIGSPVTPQRYTIGNMPLHRASLVTLAGKVFAKLDYHLANSKISSSMRNALYSILTTGAMSVGINFAESPGFQAFDAETATAIEEVATDFASYGVSLDEAAYIYGDTLIYAEQSGIPASSAFQELPMLASRNMQQALNTGTTLSGGTGADWESAVYDWFLTGKIPTTFANINPDFWTWLGQVFSSGALSGSPVVTTPPSIKVNDVPLLSTISGSLFSTQSPLTPGYPALNYYNSTSGMHWEYQIPDDGTVTVWYPKTGTAYTNAWQFTFSSSPNFYYGYTDPTTPEEWILNGNQGVYLDSSWPLERIAMDTSHGHWVFQTAQNNVVTIDARCDNGVWSGNYSEIAGALTAPPMTVIGNDAAVGTDGNLSDLGSIGAGDLTHAILPSDYGQALDQLGGQSIEGSQGTVSATEPSDYGQEAGKTVGDGLVASAPDSASKWSFMDLTKVFPFCIPWDLYGVLALFNASPVCPSVTVDMPIGINGSGLQTQSYTVDLSQFQIVASALHILLDALFVAGLAMITRSVLRS